MDAPFDTVNFGMRERPKTDDPNRLQSQLYRTIRELARAQFSGRASNFSSASQTYPGWYGDGLRVQPSASPAMSVVVNQGIGFLYVPTDVPTDIGSPDLENVDDLSPYKPSFLLAPLTFAVAAADASKSRIDIIEVRADRRLTDSVPRRQLDIASKTFLDHSFYKSLTYGLDGDTGIVTTPAASTAGISYKIGSPGLPGVAPTVTAGYVKIAEVNVAASASQITGTEIVDRRKLSGVGGVVTASASVRLQWAGGSPIATLQHVVAPPGVEFAFQALAGSRGLCNVYATAGDISHATFTFDMDNPQSLAGNFFILPRHRIVNSGGFLGAVDLTTQSAMAACATPIKAGIGQQRIAVALESLYVNVAGATVNQSDTTLEDLIYTVRLSLAYH